MLLGIGAPLLIAWATKFAGARISDKSLEAGTIPIMIEDGAIWRDGAEVSVGYSDVSNVIVRKGERRVTAGELGLSVQTGWNPFGQARVAVDSSGLPAASSSKDSPVGKRRRAVLPLEVQGHWVVAFETAGRAGSARLTILNDGGDGQAGIDRLVASASEKIPGIYERLRESLVGEGLEGGADGEAGGLGSGDGESPRSSRSDAPESLNFDDDDPYPG
jgi:hypothetical protein